jgi:hypothetical protein
MTLTWRHELLRVHGRDPPRVSRVYIGNTTNRTNSILAFPFSSFIFSQYYTIPFFLFLFLFFFCLFVRFFLLACRWISNRFLYTVRFVFIYFASCTCVCQPTAAAV